MATKKEAQTFENALTRVERIAEQMELGDLPLEQLVAVYEEGLKLIQYCSQRLEDAEKRLQTISRNAAGEPTGIKNAEEIQPSTEGETSGNERDSDKGGESAARLF